MLSVEVIKQNFAGSWLAFYSKYLTDASLNGGSEGKALCPFHVDSQASLNFNNDDGLYFCHGCKEKGDALHFYARINDLDIRRDFPKVVSGIAKDFGIEVKEEKAKLVKTYDYSDGQGTLLFQVCRMEPKDFRLRRPGREKGEWVWNLKDVEPVLYRLPELKNAQEVVICEGEKDADTAVGLGLCGTTSPMGAGKWRPEYSEYLRDKDVVLIPDNDRPGLEHMQGIAVAIRDVVKSLKWIDLPNLPAKSDLTDWVEKIGDREEAAVQLAELINRAELYGPPRERTIEDVILTEDSYVACDLPAKATIVDPWLSEQSIVLISGWRGVGKSWFGMGLVDSITRGEPFGPWPVEKPVPCLYLESEMAAVDVRERFQALNPTGAKSRIAPLYIYSDSYANHLGVSRANLLSETWRQQMKRILTTKLVKLWVIDNLVSVCSGIDENSSKEWGPVNSWLLELRFAGISTIMLHHTGKAGQQRGTSAREDNLDGSIELKSPNDYDPEQGARIIVHFSKSRVVSSGLSKIQDVEFRLRSDRDGRLAWNFGSMKGKRTAEVIQLLDEGYDQKTVGKMLSLSKGRVSQIKRSAVNDGLFSENGKLTQTGFMAIQEAEITKLNSN